MSTQIDIVTNKTAKPVVAGVFNIVMGSLCLVGVLVMAIFGIMFLPFTGDLYTDVPMNVGILLLVLAVPLAALGVVSIIGGVYSVQRRLWGWALAGSITTALTSNVLGIASIVLVAVSKDEFKA